MLEPENYHQLKEEIITRVNEDGEVLTHLRKEIQILKPSVRKIRPRGTTSISLVGTDGGNNRIQYDPFLIQLIRVVDSSNNEYCLEAVTPTSKISALIAKQFDSDGTPETALGKMMAFLGVQTLSELSPMLQGDAEGRPRSASWIQVYRELVEWAILFSIIREKEFGTDTLIVFDGLLRSKVFAHDLFKKYREGLEEAIRYHHTSHKRKIYLVGLAKHSKVFTRYQLAMALEKILTEEYPVYVEIPRELERKAYVWSEYARGDDVETEEGEINKFVGGKLFFVKFGNRPRDPIWPVDIFLPQKEEAAAILGYLLADAMDGFPIPFYPRCLQKAHENAALVDFDFDILQDQIFEGIRKLLGDESPVLDAARMQESDPSNKRY